MVDPQTIDPAIACQETTPADRARYFDSSNAFNIKYPPIPCHQFVEQRQAAFDSSTGTTMIPLDLRQTLELDYAATTPLILARYLRLRGGESLSTRFMATGEIYYVCQGAGHSLNGPDQVTWHTGDIFFLPGGRESTHTAGDENCVLWSITNEPELAFQGVVPASQVERAAVHYPAAEIQHRLLKVQEKLVGSLTPGLAVVFSSDAREQTRRIMPSLHLAMNSLPPGVSQAAHRHNAVAVTMPIDGDGCYSIIAGKRVDWQRHTVMITPPADDHAHYNPGSRQATFLIVQDGGLYYHCRTMGFTYTETPD